MAPTLQMDILGTNVADVAVTQFALIGEELPVRVFLLLNEFLAHWLHIFVAQQCFLQNYPVFGCLKERKTSKSWGRTAPVIEGAGLAPVFNSSPVVSKVVPPTNLVPVTPTTFFRGPLLPTVGIGCPWTALDWSPMSCCGTGFPMRRSRATVRWCFWPLTCES